MVQLMAERDGYDNATCAKPDRDTRNIAGSRAAEDPTDRGTMTKPINTAHVGEHRKLRFDTIDEALAEMDRIVAAEGDGRLRSLGNWTPGQVFGHVAAWIEYGYGGYPLKRPPWFVRLFLRMQLKKYLRQGMPQGVKIPQVENGTYGIEPMSTSDGAERLRRAFQRLQRGELAKFDSPAFGPISHEDRIQLNLRHAESHLGFLAIRLE